jgi:hypothetical protein
MNRGGDIIFDVEIFDWTNLWDPESLQDKITRIVLESNGGLIEGDHWEVDNPDLLFLGGDSLISSRLLVEYKCKPSKTGIEDLFLAIEVDSESGYDQGYGTASPDGPLAIYLRPRVPVSECPTSIITGLSKIKFSIDGDSYGVMVFGSGFVDGPDMEIKLVDPVNNQEVTGTNTSFVNEETFSTDFNLNGIIPGAFNIECTNGCGEKCVVPNNLPFWDGFVRIVARHPTGLMATTGRTGPWAETVDSLHLNWSPALFAHAYKIFVDTDPYSLPGPDGLTDDLQFLDLSIAPEYTHDGDSPIPFDNHSNYVYVVRTFTDIGIGNGESRDSEPVFYSGMDFDGLELNDWGYVGQYGNPIMYSINNTGYSGEGLSFDANINYLSSAVWFIIHTPEIPEIPDANQVNFEFNHRHQNFLDANGYFVGYTTEGLPHASHPTVFGVVPIEEAKLGGDYNDMTSEAIRSDYNYGDPFISNYRKMGSGWWGWYFSGFSAADVLSEDSGNHVVIGMAFWDYGSVHGFGLDDCALIIY